MGNGNLTVSERNEVQPGVRISKSLWNRFRENVRDRKGAVRGHMKTELENAIESYLQAANGGDSHDRLTRIEEDVATMKAILADAEADGGRVALPNFDADTHARADQKPNPNAPKKDKADWIITEYYNSDSGGTTEAALQTQVENEFGFGERAASDIAEIAINILEDRFGAEPDLKAGRMYYWGETLEEHKEEFHDK